MRPEISPRRAKTIVAVVSLGAFALVTTEMLPIGLLTVMAADLGRSRSEVGLLVTGYAVMVGLASLPLTRLTQRIPRRQLLSVTLTVYAIANGLAALAPTYGLLVAARVVTALSQAMFWSVASATVTGPFPPAKRGRVVAVLSTGAALAPVLGVPIGTWIGQQAGWRVAFGLLTVVGAVLAVAIVTLLPSYPPAAGGAARGTAPDRRRFTMLLIAVALGVTGFLSLQTYVAPFVLDVSGFTERALAPLLFISGVAGVTGSLGVGRTLDRHPISSLLTPLGTGTVFLLGLYALGTIRPVAAALLAGVGVSFSAFVTAMQHRMLQLAPGSTDIAAASVGTAFNVGIASGSLLGGALLPGPGPRPLALVAGALALAALAVLAADARRARRARARAGDRVPVAAADRR